MSAPLAVAVTSRVLLPKADALILECEDSIATDVDHLRFAVADGATEGFDSRRWARYLTRAWVSPSTLTLDAFDLPQRVHVLGKRLQRRWTDRRLPWYLEEKASTGAFAAFIGLQLRAEWTWSAIAIGDSCLVVERGSVIETAFPISSAEGFSSRPILIASKTDTNATREAMRLGTGVCLPGDVLLLMSDAIACWYLSNATSDRSLLDEFHQALVNHSDLTSFVARERDSRRLRNDDVAVVKLILGRASEDAI